MEDIRNIIFSNISSEIFTARIIAESEGILSGAVAAVSAAEELGLDVQLKPVEGKRVHPGSTVMLFRGNAQQLALAEDLLIGLLSKTSGIATASKQFKELAGDSFTVVCGSWKKIDSSVKVPYRKAIETGGCRCRMLDEPMVYLDKNYVIMLGGVDHALDAVHASSELRGRKSVVQVKGIVRTIGEECWLAAAKGADYVYLDTGNIQDLDIYVDTMQYMPRIPKLAFGGNITINDLENIKRYPVDLVGVGRSIIDAPMLDMKLNVIPVKRSCQGHKH